MDFKKDYYQILQVGKQATKEEIKASFRRLAKLYHPDKNPNDPSLEEKFKVINEAHDVLSSEINRFVYDEFQKHEELYQRKEPSTTKIPTQNQKTYYSTQTIHKEKRIYVKGNIVVKFWGEQIEESSILQGQEVHYTIHPTDARLIIEDSNIFPLDSVPLQYTKGYKESELFKTAIPQPIKCSIHTSEGEEHYQLTIYEIHIKEPRITNVTKHTTESFGTLEGELYGYVKEIITEEIQIPVTEYVGATGKVEQKQDNNYSYSRAEYFYKDGTTYWSGWEKTPYYSTRGPRSSTASKTAREFSHQQPLIGCLQWWWLPFILIWVIAFPKILIGLLGLIILGVCFYFLGFVFSSFSRFSIGLSWLFLGLLLFFAIRSCSFKNSIVIPHDHPRYDSVTTSITPLPIKTSDQGKISKDSLIHHIIRWKDYDSTVYRADLAISIHDLESSTQSHDQYENPRSNSLAPVYNYLSQIDEHKLARVYQSFDSIQQSNHLSEETFARMLVTCIQSIPFFLVVDRSCTDSYDQDDYVQNYLATCSKECCIGYEKYGVRSPIEFISDLKGDCDTRSVLLYTILKHYQYDIALLTSNYYKHALIAIHFRNTNVQEGLALNIHNRNYYLWETTGAGFNVGIIPPQLQNLDYWDIALLNEK